MKDLTDINIESDVPYNQAEAKKAKPKNEPHPLEPKIRAMKPGDSFFVPEAEAKDMTWLHRLGDRIGVYLASKTEKEGGEVKGARTWRRYLEQLPKGRREKIEKGVDKGEFDPEDLSYKAGMPEKEETVESLIQDDDAGTRFWYFEEEKRYFKTEPGDDITWYERNCSPATEAQYRERTRYWAFDDGRKPRITKTASAGRGLEEDDAAYEVHSEDEYNGALEAHQAANGDAGADKPRRYFFNQETEEPLSVDPAMAGRYLADPTTFVEISEKEYKEEAAKPTGIIENDDDEDLDDL